MLYRQERQGTENCVAPLKDASFECLLYVEIVIQQSSSKITLYSTAYSGDRAVGSYAGCCPV